MNLRILGWFAAVSLVSLLGSAQTLAQNAYVPNAGSDNVSVINTANNTVTATIPLPGASAPNGVAVSPNGKKVYIVNGFSNNVSVIDTASNTVTATVPVGNLPIGAAVTPDSSKVYVSNQGTNPDYVGSVPAFPT